MPPGAEANPTAPLTGTRRKSPVGFIIIGAQKCGTTSLFEYLRQHPDVYMPPQKEIGFFSADGSYGRGVDWYRSSIALEDAPRGATCGEASVAYMGGVPDQRATSNGSVAPVPPPSRNGVREDIIPRRIKEHLPDVKLICVLRDPADRCLSHYRMAVLAGGEHRSFERAISEMLRPDALEQARRSITGNNGYIVRGEYFRILSGFWRTFSPEQLMVIFSSELDSRPADVLKRSFDFIGINPDFTPSNLGVRYRQAAVARRVPGLDLYAWQDRMSRAQPTRALWHALPPRARSRLDRWYERASFRVDVWNARRGDFDNVMPRHVHETLISHFRADGEALARTLGVEVPWLARWDTLAEISR